MDGAMGELSLASGRRDRAQLEHEYNALRRQNTEIARRPCG
jgi:hypothetical protein